MHISIPSSSHAYSGHREFDVSWTQDQYGQAECVLDSTDAVDGWDPIQANGTWVVPAMNWANPSPDIIAGLLRFPEFAAATIA